MPTLAHLGNPQAVEGAQRPDCSPVSHLARIDPRHGCQRGRTIPPLREYRRGSGVRGTGAASGMTDRPSSTRTHGFLFADLRKYTSFVERRGDRAATELLRVYRELVRGVLAEFDGAEIKTEGDSFYVVFASVGSAVSCALAIQDRAAGT